MILLYINAVSPVFVRIPFVIIIVLFVVIAARVVMVLCSQYHRGKGQSG